MKKRTRPSVLRYLEERYDQDGQRQIPRRNEVQPPRPIKFKVKRVPAAGRKGVIDMTVQQFVGLAIFFVLLACIATSATTFAIVDLAGGGPQGEQGLQGSAGERGPTGLQGPPGNEASQEMVKRLAALFAVQQTSVLTGGSRIEFNDARVQSCMNYVMTGKPDVGACAGFSVGSQ